MRTVLHVDLDAFFASVEQLDRPELRGKPVLVGGSSLRGVVSAASYEARAYGCRSAMPMSQALRLCPHAVRVKGSFERYKELSRATFDILGRFTPQTQPVSIDEAFADVTGSLRLFGDGATIGRALRAAIKDELGLTASVGVAPNKFLAKLASECDKPDGLTVVEPDGVRAFLDALRVGQLWGIGPKAAERLERVGLRTVAHLRAMPAAWFDRRFGVWGARLRELCEGKDDRPVHADREAKSVGQEHTFGVDLTDADELRAVLLHQVEHVAGRLRRYGRLARVVTLKLRHGDFKTLTRRATLPRATDVTGELWAAAEAIYDAWVSTEFAPLRLIGVQCGGLTDADQPLLFDGPARARLRTLDGVADRIRARFGEDALRRGR